MAEFYFVLIFMVFPPLGFTGVPGVAMQDFFSKESCLAAGKATETLADGRRPVRWSCVKK